MQYELVEYETIAGEISYFIKKTDSNGVVWSIPEDESNSDYQQYLIDTDGGLPIPQKEEK